ncbi:hypothetical protein [Mesorhizobium marinum]|uniref:DNA breaking-rejoining protein n=1 Tax=Mesorhizobium marinum TaxID=3228790 RepID=A0ABV3R474_9HYPH
MALLSSCRQIGLTAVLAAAVAHPALAQESATVHFPAGSDGTTVSGSITGHAYFDYVLGANAGQTMSASLQITETNGDGSVYFNVLPPGSNDVAIFVGSMAVDLTAKVKLPEAGDYKLRVYLMGNDRDAGRSVAYTVDISIR